MGAGQGGAGRRGVVEATLSPRGRSASLQSVTAGRSSRGWATWAMLALGLLYAAYFVNRYRGLWTENDTALFSGVAVQTMRAGTVLFPGQYSHGFGYPGFLAALGFATSLSPALLNTVVLPYAGVLLLMLVSLVLYRRLLRSQGAGVLAAGLLLLAPDLMFAVVRGNHEKLNVALLLISFYALFKGFAAARRRRGGDLAAWVVVFYLCTLVNACVNDYFASTFVLAEAMAMAILWAIDRLVGSRARWSGGAVARLALVSATSWLLVWWVMLYVFQPAGADFRLLGTAIQRLTHLFLSLHARSNPFAAVAQQWAGRTAQIAVAAFRYLLILGSFVVWLWDAVRLVRRRAQRVPVLERAFLFGVYAGFAVLVAVAVPLDFTGIGAGTNLEVRNFTYFGLVAAPVLARGVRLLTAAAHRGRARRRTTSWRLAAGAGRVAVAVACTGLLGISLLKVTLDPVISNQWIFYSPAERQALAAFWNHARASALWTGPDNRLVYVQGTWSPSNPYDNQIVGYSIASRPQIRNLLISPVVDANAIAESFPLPYLGGMNQVYQNGGARILHDAPQTIFES